MSMFSCGQVRLNPTRHFEGLCRQASELLCLRAKEAGVFTHQLPVSLVVDSRHSGLSREELSLILQPSGKVDRVCTEKLKGSVTISLEGMWVGPCQHLLYPLLFSNLVYFLHLYIPKSQHIVLWDFKFLNKQQHTKHVFCNLLFS